MERNEDAVLFFEEESRRKARLKDILWLILHNLHWLILCALAGAFIATYYARKQERIYQSKATIILKNATVQNGQRSVYGESAMMSGYSGAMGRFVSSTIKNEIFVMKSNTTMLEVVKRLGLNQYYYAETQIVRRRKDLYKTSPVEVTMLDAADNTSTDFTIVPENDSTAVLSIADFAPVTAHFGDTVSTPLGRIVVNSTWFLTPHYVGVPIYFSRRSAMSVAERYRAMLNVSYDDETASVVYLSIKDTSPQRAADIVNTTIQVYNDDMMNDKSILLEYTNNYINQRLAELSEDLGTNQNEIAAFKRNNVLLSVESYGQQYLAASLESTAEIENLQRQLTYSEYMLGQLSDADDTRPLASSMTIEDGTVAGVISQYNELAFELSRYGNGGAVNNPTVRSLKKQMDTMRENLINILGRYMETVNQRIVNAQAQEMEATTQVQKVPYGQIYLSNVERLQNIREALYQELLSKREDMMINQPVIEGSAKIVDEARVDTAPIAPDETHWTLMGLLLGVAVPVLLYMIYRFLYTKVEDRREVESIISVPFVGEIPTKDKNDDRYVVVDEAKRDKICEAFRYLRTNIDFLVSEGGSKTFLLTSFFESSGKTFIAGNLAVCYAMIGKRVALVDLDLRKGMMTKRFGKRGAKGVSDYLVGKIDSMESIANTDSKYPMYDRYYTGPLPPNPSELLSSARMASMMEYLQANYDCIFLDCVPAGIVVDSDVVKKYVDSTMFVIRAGNFDKRLLPEVQKMYDESSFPGLCVILNDVKIKNLGKKLGYGYSYAYGYGYGYGRNQTYGSDYGINYGSDADYDEEYSNKDKAEKNGLLQRLMFWKKKK